MWIVAFITEEITAIDGRNNHLMLFADHAELKRLLSCEEHLLKVSFPCLMEITKIIKMLISHCLLKQAG